MLRTGEINPLDVHALRRMAHCPPHFTQVMFDLATDEKRITDWVFTNLAGRFYFGDYHYHDKNGRRSMSKLLSFEIPGEASYFGLFIDQINQRNNW
jgi:hypothetical protein